MGKICGKQKRQAEACLLSYSQATNYLEAAAEAEAGAEAFLAEAEAGAEAFFEAAAEAAEAAGAEAAAEADWAKAETENRPAIRAAIRFFILNPSN